MNKIEIYKTQKLILKTGIIGFIVLLAIQLIFNLTDNDPKYSSIGFMGIMAMFLAIQLYRLQKTYFEYDEEKASFQLINDKTEVTVHFEDIESCTYQPNKLIINKKQSNPDAITIHYRLLNYKEIRSIKDLFLEYVKH